MQELQLKPRRGALNTSTLSLHEACPATMCFDPGWSEKPKPWMWWGIGVHRFIEYACTRGREAALDYTRQKFPRTIKTCQRINVASIPDGDHEVGYAHEVEKRITHRFRFPERPTADLCVQSRADLIFNDQGLPHGADWKTGKTPETPVDHDQLLGIACAARDEAGTSEARASIVSIPSTGHLVWRSVTYSQAKLDGHSERLTAAIEAQRDLRGKYQLGVLPEFRPGEHCGQCRMRPACPEHVGELRLVS